MASEDAVRQAVDSDAEIIRSVKNGLKWLKLNLADAPTGHSHGKFNFYIFFVILLQTLHLVTILCERRQQRTSVVSATSSSKLLASLTLFLQPVCP